MAEQLKTWQGIVLAIVFYLLVGYINQYVSENTVSHVIDLPPLYDRGHNAFPVISKTYPDVAVILIVAYFVIRWGIRYPKVLENYLWIVTVLFVGRVVMFSVTQLPPPHPGCTSKKQGDPKHYRVLRKTWMECKDLIYSGHTLHSVLVLLFVLYLSKSIFEKALLSVVVGITLVLIIASRIHYTVDVLLATFISILVFYAWPGVDKVIQNITQGGLYGITLSQTHDLTK
jgi:hypothetical protein